ncbi:MAG: sensor histidine kinase [Bacteroidia bacterium]
MTVRRSRPLFFFYLLVCYVLLQFGWWTYLLVRNNREKANLQRELVLLQETQDIEAAEINIKSQEKKQWLMIAGEGAVFLILLVIGIVQTRNSFRREAELAERQKNFLLSVTHELKSPLASARLQHETLIRHALTREKQIEILHDATEDIDRLHTLVDNILLAARIDNSSYLVHPEVQNIAQFISDLAEKAKATTLRSHKLAIRLVPEVQASFDSIALHSIVMNLLENAAKYTPPNSSVELILQKNQQHQLLLAIADSGPGIAPAERERVFDKFYRIGSEETRSTKGTGLGLFIVRHLVEAHHWEINVLENEGGGARFEIYIPLAQ